MIKLLLLAIGTSFASSSFIHPRLTENLAETAKLQQCMRVQVAKALSKKPADIWGFHGPFLLTGSPELVEYNVRLASGYKYKLRFMTAEHHQWSLFQYVSVNGDIRIGAMAEEMLDHGHLMEKNTERVNVDLVPCKTFIEAK